jgi:hypothetical protein
MGCSRRPRSRLRPFGFGQRLFEEWGLRWWTGPHFSNPHTDAQLVHRLSSGENRRHRTMKIGTVHPFQAVPQAPLSIHLRVSLPVVSLGHLGRGHGFDGCRKLVTQLHALIAVEELNLSGWSRDTRKSPLLLHDFVVECHPKGHRRDGDPHLRLRWWRSHEEIGATDSQAEGNYRNHGTERRFLHLGEHSTQISDSRCYTISPRNS